MSLRMRWCTMCGTGAKPVHMCPVICGTDSGCAALRVLSQAMQLCGCYAIAVLTPIVLRVRYVACDAQWCCASDMWCKVLALAMLRRICGAMCGTDTGY
eukprot:539890-Rhodomonas_salina.1